MAVTYSTHGNWAEVILDRPERKNAIVGPLGVELAEALEAANAAQDIDAVLLRGRGGAFCSGLDLDEFNADPPPDWMAQWPSTWRRAHRALFECNKPIVGALERYAINGGAALMLGCDFVIVGEQSFLQVGEVQLGMAAPYNLAWLALRHGEAVSAKLAMIGDRVYGADLVAGGKKWNVLSIETDDGIDAVTFLQRAQGNLSKLSGLELSGERVSAIKCYLTGERLPNGQFSIRRLKIKDKHGLSRTAFNAKVNIYRETAQPILLGIEDSKLSPARQSA